jgi:hypothetical protein
MKFGYNSRQIMAGLTLGFLMVTGTYNAIVINSESIITGTDIRFAKRLDEVYGVVLSKREVATSMPWQKLSIKQAALYKANKMPSKNIYQNSVASSGTESAPVEVAAQAAVQEDLNLSLTGVINPKKWQQGLNNSQFNGSLSTNQGVIESLSVSLPNGEGLSVSFSEMTGNVFEYDYNGELYSGMMYQENQNSYVVTLTNGPLEGTRLSFTGEASLEQNIQQEDNQRMLAEGSQAEAGVQAEEAPQPEVAQVDQDQSQDQSQDQNQMSPDQQMQQEGSAQDIYAQEQGQLDQPQEQAQGFNFEQSQASM